MKILFLLFFSFFAKSARGQYVSSDIMIIENLITKERLYVNRTTKELLTGYIQYKDLNEDIYIYQEGKLIVSIVKGKYGYAVTYHNNKNDIIVDTLINQPYLNKEKPFIYNNIGDTSIFKYSANVDKWNYDTIAIFVKKCDNMTKKTSNLFFFQFDNVIIKIKRSIEEDGRVTYDFLKDNIVRFKDSEKKEIRHRTYNRNDTSGIVIESIGFINGVKNGPSWLDLQNGQILTLFYENGILKEKQFKSKQ